MYTKIKNFNNLFIIYIYIYGKDEEGFNDTFG